MPADQTNSIKKNQSDISFQDIFENVPIGILVFDEEWQIISVNDNFLKIGAVQVKEKKLVGQNLLNLNLFEETQIKNELEGKFVGSINWYTETVKLDLEARFIIERIKEKKPQVYRIKITQ